MKEYYLDIEDVSNGHHIGRLCYFDDGFEPKIGESIAFIFNDDDTDDIILKVNDIEHVVKYEIVNGIALIHRSHFCIRSKASTMEINCLDKFVFKTKQTFPHKGE